MGCPMGIKVRTGVDQVPVRRAERSPRVNPLAGALSLPITGYLVRGPAPSQGSQGQLREPRE